MAEKTAESGEAQLSFKMRARVDACKAALQKSLAKAERIRQAFAASGPLSKHDAAVFECHAKATQCTKEVALKIDAWLAARPNAETDAKHQDASELVCEAEQSLEILCEHFGWQHGFGFVR